MEIIETTLHVAWALHWLLIAMAFAVLGAAYAATLLDLWALRRQVEELKAARRRLIAQLAARSAR